MARSFANQHFNIGHISKSLAEFSYVSQAVSSSDQTASIIMVIGRDAKSSVAGQPTWKAFLLQGYKGRTYVFDQRYYVAVVPCVSADDVNLWLALFDVSNQDDSIQLIVSAENEQGSDNEYIVPVTYGSATSVCYTTNSPTTPYDTDIFRVYVSAQNVPAFPFSAYPLILSPF